MTTFFKAFHGPRLAMLALAALALAGCRDDRMRAADLVKAGAAQEAQGDLDAAQKSYAAAIAADPESPEPRRAAARLFLKSDKFDRAAAQYAALRERLPKDAEANIALAELALRDFDTEQASYYLKVAEKVSPRTPRVLGDSAALDFQTADLAGDSAGRARAIKRLEQALAADPSVYAARAALIHALAKGPSPADALPLIEAGLALGAHRLDLEMLKLYVLQKMDDDRAIGQMKLIYRDFPDNPDIQTWLSDYYAAEGDPKDAIAFFADLAARRGDPPEDHRRLIAYISARLPADAAKAALEEVARGLAPGATAATYRAEVLKLQFGTDKGDAALAEMLDLTATGGPLARAPDALSAAAGMLDAKGRRPEAQAMLDRLLAVDPMNDAAVAMKARWLLDDKDVDGALGLLMSAVSRARPDPDHLLLLAQTYEQKNLPALAQDALARAVQASGNGARETLLFARFLSRNGQRNMAERLVRENLAMHPADAELRAFAQTLGVPVAPLEATGAE